MRSLLQPFFWLLLGLATLAPGRPAAQTTAPLPPTLNVSVAGTVHAIAPLPQGGYVIGGEFVSIDGVARRNVARIGRDGELDRAWQAPLVSGPVLALATDEQGHVYLGGEFFSVGELIRHNLARLRPDGSLDGDWFVPVEGADGASVTHLLRQGDHLYVAGSFSLVQGVGRARLARVLLDGALDLGWRQGVSENVTVYALALAPGWLIVAGSVPEGKAMRVSLQDGLTDPDWRIPRGFDADAVAVAHGWVYLGGDRAVERFSLADASHDAGWSMPIPDGFIEVLMADDERLYVGGTFEMLDGQPRRSLAAVDLATGAVDAWDPDLQRTGSASVYALAIDLDRRLLVGGRFTGRHAPHPLSLTVYTADGRVQAAPGVEKPGDIYALAATPDGGLIAGGGFARVNGEPRFSLARLDAQGRLDPLWRPRVFAADVLSLLVDGDSVFVGGSSVGPLVEGGPDSALVRLVGPQGSPDPAWSPGMRYDVHAIARDAQGWLYAGGNFCFDAACTPVYLARFVLATGLRDADWNPVLDDDVHALASTSEGLYAGGEFLQVEWNGMAEPRPYLARFDDAGLSPWRPVDGDLNGPVRALATDVVDTGLYVGGGFSAVGTRSRPRVAKIDRVDGSLHSWRPLVSEVFADMLFESEDGPWVTAIQTTPEAVYLGGTFASVNLESRFGLAKLDRIVTTSPVFQPRLHDWKPRPQGLGPYATGLARLALLTDGRVAVGGRFDCLGDRASVSLALMPDEHGAPLFRDGFEAAPDGAENDAGACNLPVEAR